MQASLTTDAAGGGAEEAEGEEDLPEYLQNQAEADPVDEMLAAEGEASPILEPAEDEDEDFTAHSMDAVR
jgi:hypothetical protein